MNFHRRKEAFIALGQLMGQYSNTRSLHESKGSAGDRPFVHWQEKIRESTMVNPWFTEENVNHAIASLAHALKAPSVNTFAGKYQARLAADPQEQTVAVIMAGNIPLAGFHDFLCVLLSGHRLKVKLSGDDPILLKLIADELIGIEPSFRDKINFTEERLTGFDAVIATGSDNTSRYFEYYFARYPHIIRRNRNSLAVLTGKESADSLNKLGEDIFRYFGLGCRNVSKIFVPENYNWQRFLEALQPYAGIINQNKYWNNYTYNKTIYILNREQFYDNGFFLLREEKKLGSPLAVLHFEYYKILSEVSEYIKVHELEIQCVVSESGDIKGSIGPGSSQHPALWDYADNIDTMDFLLSL